MITQRARKTGRRRVWLCQVTLVLVSLCVGLLACGASQAQDRPGHNASAVQLMIYLGHSSELYSAIFSPDGQFILTASRDHTMRLWETATGRELRRFERHAEAVTAGVFAPDGRAILTVSADHTARLWDTATGQELRRFEGHAEAVTAGVFAPDGRAILTVSADHTVHLWDTATGEELRRFEGAYASEDFDDHSTLEIFAHFSPDGRTILTGSGNIAHLWDTATGQELRSFKGHTREVTSATFAPDGRSILTGKTTTRGFNPKDQWKYLMLWDVGSGRELLRREGYTDSEGRVEDMSSVVFAPDGRSIFITAFRDWSAHLLDVPTGQWLGGFNGVFGTVSSTVFSPDNRTILTVDNAGMHLWDVATRRELRKFEGSIGIARSEVFSPNGLSILTTNGKAVYLWDTVTGQELCHFDGFYSHYALFSPDGQFILTTSFESAYLWDTTTCQKLRRFEGHTDAVNSVVFAPDSRSILTRSGRAVRLWDVATGRELRRFEGHTNVVDSVVFAPDGRSILTASRDGTTRLWDAQNGNELSRLVSFTDGTWVVATPDGRIDTNDPEEIKDLHWVMPDDPFRALPPQIFMRDYYEPRLLPRMLAGKLGEFKAVRPLQELNRAQPQVIGIKPLWGTEKDRVDVEVEVAGGVYKNANTGTTQYSSVHDLRLFRDGQLVGQWPEPKESTPDGVSGAALAQWQADTQVVQATGRTKVTFHGIRLPHRWPEDTVEFSAYAFNEDRVKGETVRTKTTAVAGEVTKRAYIVAMGVDDYGNDRWNLRYASQDARAMAQALVPRLKQAGYDPQVTVLGSDADQQRPRKATIRAAIEELAGKSTPDDVVILFFSGHGYSGEQGAFYLLPDDSQPSSEPNWRRPAQASLARTISAEELSRWIRKIDAAEMVLIIDACHSAASIEGEGFKPGPLGSKGLGQLAYDKRMRVLAASQSDQAAREMGGQIGAGVLTYALVHDALQAKQAADEKGTITLTRWLEYPVTRVPQLFEELRTGKVNEYGVAVAKDAIPPEVQGTMTQKWAVQVPALFDYTRGAQAGVLLQGAATTSP